jgi:urease accessory protein UreF
VSALRVTGRRLVELGAPDGSGLLGDLRALIEQLGSGEADAAHSFATPPSFKALTQFLESYKRNVLIPHEWLAIYRAYLHTRQGECQELIALDLSLANEKALVPFADASRRIGQFQLSRLGPLRGERVLARYITAIDEGRAHGWHTLVYGLTLAIYSLPARQGLMHYAHQILRSYLESGAAAFSVSDEESNAALENLLGDLPRELDKVLTPAL